jgi:formate dehydrogenase subunit gamma
MTLSSDVATRLPRFTAGERWTHRTVGILVGILLITAALLYVPDLSAVVGNRQTVRVIHEIAGFALPIPLVIAAFSRAFREDAGRLNRFHPADWKWLRSRDRRSGTIRVGKFNAGQKLNAAFSLGAIIVMLATGAMMFFSSRFPDYLRTGATFVHDWLALALLIVVCGHMYMAFNDATARLGMRTGSVPLAWAEREHGDWADELTGQTANATEATAEARDESRWVGDA